MTRILPILFLTLVIASCGGDDDRFGSTSDGMDTTQLAPGAPPSKIDSATAVDTAGPVVTHVATILTDSGDVVFELFGEDAPRTVENFVGLAEKGFYKGIAFHRVLPGYVAQAGDPLSKDSTKRAEWGQGGESIYGTTFEDELDTAKPSAKLGYSQGIVAMANRGPNTNSSQFFIVLSDGSASQLPYSYTIFGRVREGDDALRRIESTGFTGEVPLVPSRIMDVKVVAVR